VLHGGATGEFPMGAPHAHNTLLALAAQYGLPAALLHLAWLGALLRAAWLRRAADRAGWCLAAALVGAALTGGMLEYLAAQGVTCLALYALLGLALAPSLDSQERSQSL
jgi:O-antigen ligase